MRITIVTGFFLPVPPVLGGATEKIWFRLAGDLAARGHEVTMISRAWPGFASREKAQGVTHLRLAGADHSRSLAANLWQDFLWGLRVARALPPGDAVICNTVTLPVWLRRIKPSAGRVIAVVARMPKGHGRAYGGADRLFALSEAVAARLRAENPRLAPRIGIVPFPIDWAALAAAAGPRAGPAATIGFVGRVHPEKGIELLLRAAVRLAERHDLPDWRLEIVGPAAVPAGGGGEAWRDRLLADHGAALGSRLAFREAEFDPAKLARIYGAFDVFCYPSLAAHGETFGVAVAEAMAAGCAPVVSNLACFNGLVRDGETGLVFGQDGEEADVRLARALGRLLADGALRRAMAGRAQEWVRRFDHAIVAETVVKELELTVSRQ